MKTLRVNDYDMAYLDIGQGPPLVCVHGSLNDFRAWAAVFKPLSANRQLIVPSLRHYFPEHWDGTDDRFNMAQHVDDMIAFIEGLSLGPVDLIGHSRGGHLAFRLALKRPELLRKLVLAEPGGTLEETLIPDGVGEGPPAAGSRAHVAQASEKTAAGDLDGGLRAFIDGINGPGAWDALPGGGTTNARGQRLYPARPSERRPPALYQIASRGAFGADLVRRWCRYARNAGSDRKDTARARPEREVGHNSRCRAQHVPSTTKGVLRCRDSFSGIGK
jgi:pimeloyl-ACP methyl ester carboxylesterase